MRRRAQRDMTSVETVRDELAQHRRMKTGVFLEILVMVIRQLIYGDARSSDETAKVLCFTGPQYVCWVCHT